MQQARQSGPIPSTVEHKRLPRPHHPYKIMIEQTTALTLSAEITGVDIHDGQITANVKGGDTIRITGITMETWLKEFRYLISSFEWRSESVQQQHKNQLGLLQDSLADVLQKIHAKTEVSA